MNASNMSESPEEFQWDADGGQQNPPGRLIISPGAPRETAEEFRRRERPHIIHTADEFLGYQDGAYREIEEATIASELSLFLASAVVRTKDGDDNWKIAKCNPTPGMINSVSQSLQHIVHVPRDRYTPPCWLDGDGPAPSELISCRNGLLHLPTGDLLPPTPRFFTRNSLDFDYNPNAATPQKWHDFLHSIWSPGDESIDLLQEIAGYLLVPNTALQKIFFLLGPRRSGKGTILRILRLLIGAANACSPTLGSLAGSFGLQPLIGRQLATISDLRIGPKTDQAALAERLLTISGEDDVSVARKFKENWEGKLATRFVLVSNEIPRFVDASGALAGRMVPLRMTRSFFGHEDPGLMQKLIPELPGILHWAVEGWRRLRARGHFEMPPASRETVEQIEDAASPVTVFVSDECILDPEGSVEKAALYTSWMTWAHRNGHHPGAAETLGRNLLAAFSGQVHAARLRQNGERARVFVGLRLRENTDA